MKKVLTIEIINTHHRIRFKKATFKQTMKAASSDFVLIHDLLAVVLHINNETIIKCAY